MRLSFKTKRGKIYFEIYIYRSSDPFNEQKLLLDYLDKEAEQIGRNSNIHEFRPRFPDVRDKLQITTKRHAISFSPSPPFISFALYNCKHLYCLLSFRLLYYEQF